MIIAMIIIGYIDSYFLIWAVLGILLMISISEAKKLFQLESDSIYVYSALLWFAAYFYPTPEDLIFIVAIGSARTRGRKYELEPIRNTSYMAINAL